MWVLYIAKKGDDTEYLLNNDKMASLLMWSVILWQQHACSQRGDWETHPKEIIHGIMFSSTKYIDKLQIIRLL